MNDTRPEAESRLKEMMMKKSGQERMMMGFSMFDFARRQVIASIRAEKPEATEKEIRKELFLRFYGQDFNQGEKEKILVRLLNRS